jgi:hypothetical protein
MRKVKSDTKSDKIPDALFGNQNLGENASLTSVNSVNISNSEKENSFRDKHQSFVNILKQVFIFLPGTFLLFFMSFGAAVIFMEIFVFGRTLETLPNDFPFQFALIGLIAFAGSLMTWFGLGDIKNRKHFAIPASIMVTGMITGAVVKVAAKISDLADRMMDDFSYLIYLLPWALITPILAKSIVDRKTEDA